MNSLNDAVDRQAIQNHFSLAYAKLWEPAGDRGVIASMVEGAETAGNLEREIASQIRARMISLGDGPIERKQVEDLLVLAADFGSLTLLSQVFRTAASAFLHGTDAEGRA